MGISVEGQKCPICNGYLFDDDDIVFCPVCGAAHHRDCYNAVGHCFFEDKHGTDEQYDIAKARAEQEAKESAAANNTAADEGNGEEHGTPTGFKCHRCGADLTPDTRICPSCHTPVNIFERAYVFDENEDIGGVKAVQIARFTLVNPARYLETFRRIALGEKSWNWAAFLLPASWQFFRKNYKEGAVFATLEILSKLLAFPLSAELSKLAANAETYMEFTQVIANNISQIGIVSIVLGFVALLLNIGTRIIAGIMSDKLYFNRAAKTIKDAGLDAADEVYTKKGGVSFLGFLIAFGAMEYLPSILLSIANIF